MKGILKFFAWLIGIVALLIVAAVILVPIFVDPNDYKGTITDAVKDQTGRDLTIEGDIRLSVFPRISVKTGAVRLSNPEGFGDDPMLSLQEASINVALTPLLSKRVEADEIILKRPAIHLITLADGRNNFDDLMADSDAADSPADATEESIDFDQSFAIQGVRIEDAELIWDDRATATRVDVKNLSVVTGPVAPDAPIDVSITARAEGTALPEALDVNSTAIVTLTVDGPAIDLAEVKTNIKGATIDTTVGSKEIKLDLANNTATIAALTADAKVAADSAALRVDSITTNLDSLTLDINAVTAQAAVAGTAIDANIDSGQVALTDNTLQLIEIVANVTQGEVRAKLNAPMLAGEIDAQRFTVNGITIDAAINDWAPQVSIPNAAIDLQAGQLNLDNINVTEGDLSADVAVVITDLNGSPKISGQLHKPGGSVRQMLKALADYEPASENAFQNVALDVSFEASQDRVNIATLSGDLDGTKLNGNASIALEAGDYTVNLDVGALNVDDYLPKPGSPATPSQAQDSGSAAPASAAGAFPDKFNLSAAVNLQALTMASAGIALTDISMRSTPNANSTGIPVVLTANVAGDALPEPVAIEAATSIDDSARQPVLRDLSVTANGETLQASLDIPVFSLPGDDATMRLNSINGEFSHADTKAIVNVGDLAFDTARMAMTIENFNGNARQAELSSAFAIPSLTADLNTQRFAVDGFSAEINAPEPLGKLEIQSLTVDASAETLVAPNIVLNTDAGSLTASLDASGLLSTPAISGNINAENLNLRQFLNAAKIDLGLSDDTALSRFSIDAEFDGQGEDVKLPRLTAAIDDTQVTGSFSMRQSPSPKIDFDLDVGELDLDRYLGAGDESDTSAPADAASAPAATQSQASDPLSALKDLALDGKIRVAKLVTSGIAVENIEIDANAIDDVLTIEPFKAQLLDGTVEGRMTLDVSGDIPKITLKESLVGVDVGAALSATDITDKLEGFGNLEADIEAQGIDADSITRTLRGGVKFNLRDGAVKGFDLQKLLRQAKELYAANKGDDSSLTAPPEDETKFSELSGSLAIDNGIANNDDLDMKAPAFRVAGKGTASLVEQTIDYLLTVNIVDSIEGQGGAELNDLKNVPIPVTITGNLESPNYGIDLAALVKDKATDELKKKLQEELQDQLKLNVPQSSDTATETTSGEAAAAAGATPEQQADQPPEADKDPEDVLKDELKKKLLKGLFN